MKFVFGKIATFILGLVFLWLLFMFLGWVWDHKGAIFLLVVGMTAIGFVVFLLSNKDSSKPDELMMVDNVSGDKDSSLTDKNTEQLKVDDKQVLTPEIKLDKAEVGMNELTHMLQIIDPEYVQRTLSQIYSDVEKKVGRGISQNEEALIAAAIFIGLTQAQNDSSFRIKKSKSLARASSLAVMRALAFNIDEEASTGLFREKLDISQASIDKEIINTIDNNLSDSNYSRSTSRVVLLSTTDFLNEIGFDVWKNKLDVDRIETNVGILLNNVLKTVAGDGTNEESYVLFRMSLDLCKAYRVYNEEADDFSALYYIS